MKRKTNLFYTDGSDSNFITFSNYTENLTGNFLSGDTKLYPYLFLCLYIEDLDVQEDAENREETYLYKKKKYIEYLCRYYENKLTFLREYCRQNDELAEVNLYPLSYLIEAIKCAVYNPLLINTYGNHYELIEEFMYVKPTAENMNTMLNERNKIVFIGDNIEFDYNGIYTDTILSINGDKKYDNVNCILSSITQQLPVEEETYTKILYGWTYNELLIDENFENKPPKDINNTTNYKEKDICCDHGIDPVTGERIPCPNDCDCNTEVEDTLEEDLNEDVDYIPDYKEYAKLMALRKRQYQPIFDDDKQPLYSSLPLISGLEYPLLIDDDKNPDYNYKDLKFNIIIPLYNVTSLLDNNENPLSEKLFTNTQNTKIINIGKPIDEQTYMYDVLVPYGIWFSGVNPVELKYDKINKLRSSWSLTLSSQFKPFPYANRKIADENNPANVTKYTFAEVLKKYTEISDSILNLNSSILQLNNRLLSIEHKLNNLDIGLGNVDSEAYLDIITKLQILETRTKNLENYQNNNLTWNFVN